MNLLLTDKMTISLLTWQWTNLLLQNPKIHCRIFKSSLLYSSCLLGQLYHHHHHHHYHLSVMQLGHLLTRSGLTCPEASSKVCQSGSSVSLPWVIYYEAFCLHVVSSFSCIPVICPKLELF
jgi:hypothetical protein